MISKPTKRVKRNTEALDADNYTNLDDKPTKKRNRALQNEPRLSNSALLADFEETYDKEQIMELILGRRVNNFKIREVCTIDSFKQEHPSSFRDLQSHHSALSRTKKAKILVLGSDDYENQPEYYALCRGPWKDLTYQLNQSVTVIGYFNKNTRCVELFRPKLTDTKFSQVNFMVLSPEKLIKVTSLTGDHIDCDRLKILSTMYTQWEPQNRYGLDGTIQHNLFEQIVQLSPSRNISEGWIRELVQDKMGENIEHIYLLENQKYADEAERERYGYNYEKEYEKLVEVCKKLIKWKEDYMQKDSVKWRGLLRDSTNDQESDEKELDEQEGKKVSIKILEVESTEKRYESTLYGLVGIIDAVFKCEVHRHDLGGKKEVLSVPFELKTGTRTKDGYQTQVMLYNLMMNESNLDTDSGYGIVYYSNLQREPDLTTMRPVSLFNVFMYRNRLIAQEGSSRNQFSDLMQFKVPKRVADTNKCRFCPVKPICVATNVFDEVFDSEEKKRALVLFNEQENEKRIKEVSGLRNVYNSRLSDEKKRKQNSGFKGSEIELEFETPSKSNTQGNKTNKSDGRVQLVSSQLVAPEEMDLEELMKDFELEQEQKEKENLGTIVEQLKMVEDIEDLITEDQPNFPGFAEVFDQLSLPKMKYFAKWMDLTMLEQHDEFKRAKKSPSQNKMYFDLESVEDLRIMLNDKLFKRHSPQYTILTFSTVIYEPDLHPFQMFERLRVDSKIRLTHPQSKTGITGILKHKSIKKKKLNDYIFFDCFSLKIACNYYHAKKQTEQFIGRKGNVNLDKLRTNWVYQRSNYSFNNSMRAMVVDLVTNPEMSFLADLVVDLRPPRELDIKFNLDKMLKKKVNSDQKAAIHRALRTDSFSLILGMPGTGKTRTICILIDLLIRMGKRVLVTSFTHSAVDNMILKYLSMFGSKGQRIVRMSASRGTNDPSIKRVEYKPSDYTTLKDVKKFLGTKRAFFTTCLSISNPLLTAKKFDYVIVDESSQVVEIKLMKCLGLGKKFVLIGDFLQLCPIIRSPEAQLRGMGISLLERLCLAHPEWVNKLTFQVRSIFLPFPNFLFLFFD